MSEKRLTDGSLALNEKKVIVIEKAERPESQKLRVAAYARVSSDSTDQLNSFMAQTNYYSTLISSNENWTMADIYADEGITGTSAQKRPDFQRLLSDCRKGRVDKILVKSISRFARNTTECLETIRELKSIGVGVCFEEQGIDTSDMSGELLTAVFAAIAQKESESISGNMRWSYQQRMKSGTYLPSSVPYGYVIQNKKIQIDEKCADIVRRIFHDYLDGLNMDEIAAKLNQEKVTAPIGKEGLKWRECTISYILSNERYIGDSLWQKTYTSSTLPFQRAKNRGECEKYYVEGTHEPIIEKELFFAVQELKQRRYAGPRKGNVAAVSSPFQKRIYCGECGSVFKKKICRGKTYWICRSHFKDKDSCPVVQIPEEEIQSAFLRLYHKLKIHGSPILTQMVSYLQQIREKRMLWRMDIIELNKRISDISDQNRMLADMNKLGLVDSDIFISQSNELNRQLQAAKQEKERLVGGRDDDTILKTKELMETLELMPAYLAAFDGEIFDELVEKVTANSNALCFRLKNGLELTEHIKRTVR
ncbi:recombinase family protein [Oscillibacter sp.]|uniref:recombinase family protein n=1 Tax=Oscillibacter sp. TaxID=1945593 RepID=UPI001B6EEF16|nr:recombinase family protein [Oscillibacter sp.]MBP3509330.1 recombinase family protein [Oscillibacter sp.]